MEATTRSSKTKYLILGAAVAVLLVGFMSVSMARTSTTEYCTSCHEMKTNLEEMKKSSHALDANKKPIECAQCHVPINLGPKYLVVKTVVGMKDLVTHYLGDPDNLNRRDMQDIARRFVPDENCQACHQDLYRNAKGDKEISAIGRLCHDAWAGKNGNTSKGCAGCHFNMAHLPNFDRRYDFNAEFASRLPLKEEGTKR